MVKMQEARSKHASMDLSMEHPKMATQEMDLRVKLRMKM